MVSQPCSILPKHDDSFPDWICRMLLYPHFGQLKDEKGNEINRKPGFNKSIPYLTIMIITAKAKLKVGNIIAIIIQHQLTY